jgi:hypothetical protein
LKKKGLKFYEGINENAKRAKKETRAKENDQNGTDGGGETDTLRNEEAK